MRTPARVLGLALSFVVMFVAGTGAALADQPVGPAWPDGEGRSTLDTLLVFGGGTVVLFIVISLFGLLTARNNYVPPPPSTELATTGDKAPVHH
ncbi:hypothetical protein [Aeromicrobium sp. UC242_57]|uniref:hypothetical protein n=1 Tax=Aeromicrobium sp. UC242_57 TaxID=3374624 RepID=UPI0037A78BDC